MLSSLPKSVRIVEVGPRDGLQNEKTVLDTADKAEYIKMLHNAGLKTIEVTSFVRPDRIAQMSDAKELFPLVSNLMSEQVNLPCLVPNLIGLEKAISLGVREVAIFTATSDTFNKKNINASVEESLERLAPVAKLCKEKGIKLRGYISTVFGCPYEGETSLEKLDLVISKLKEYGCYDISLGDTIGAANPLQVKSILNHVKKSYPITDFSMHFHDTSGTALANTLSALEAGCISFDSSSGGLGGCPYANGATGNVATEDLVNLLHSMGINTGVDMEKLTKASSFILKKLNKSSSSKYYNAFIARSQRS